MRHFASNFMTRFKDKILKNLVCRAALASTERKFKKHMNTIGRINFEALQWLEAIPVMGSFTRRRSKIWFNDNKHFRGI